MLARLARFTDSFFRRGDFSVTVAVLDGPLRPNQLLEEASRVFAADDLDNLVSARAGAVFSSGGRLLEWSSSSGHRQLSQIECFDSAISCLGSDNADGLAIGFDAGGVLIRGGHYNGKRIEVSSGSGLNCPTAIAFLDPHTLVVTNGSAARRPSEWKRDLMSLGASGSVSRIDLATSSITKLCNDMSYPSGLATTLDGRLLVSLAWAHRVVSLPVSGGSPSPTVLDDLPGYPSRILRSAAGGYWLAVFAVRTQLTEFVLREKEYRTRMMDEIPMEYWVGPDFTSGKSFLEPMQGGSIKQLGILKPWAPPRSYGLILRCDEGLNPIASYHSRADGKVHGINSACEIEGILIAGAKGPGLAVGLPVHSLVPESRQ